MTNAKTQERKPSVSIIGAGRLGQALALALRASGYPILAFVARRASHARKAAELFNKSEKPVRSLGANQFDQLPPSDLILITTPDDAIEETARQLAACETGQARRRTILHTSGALSSKVLSPLAKAGFHTGSLHPLVSVSEPLAGANALRGAFYCLEGDREAMRLARLVVSDLGGNSFSIRPESKALYHAAAVMASGHVVALFDFAAEMLAACGVSQKNAKRILMPLLESTVNNLRQSDTEKALTGTFARGDLATVRRHLAALSRREFSQALEIYKLLGRRSVQLSEKNGQAPQVLNEIKTILGPAKTRKK
jgi:predicted short-subunit dehydrogenase-like oxidoreductase (DUF2520 family)